jgi:hypothetical protein
MSSADDLARLAEALQPGQSTNAAEPDPPSLAEFLWQQLERQQEAASQAQAFTGFDSIAGAMEK